LHYIIVLLPYVWNETRANGLLVLPIFAAYSWILFNQALLDRNLDSECRGENAGGEQREVGPKHRCQAKFQAHYATISWMANESEWTSRDESRLLSNPYWGDLTPEAFQRISSPHCNSIRSTASRNPHSGFHGPFVLSDPSSTREAQEPSHLGWRRKSVRSHPSWLQKPRQRYAE
jgi:hypothetical protein